MAPYAAGLCGGVMMKERDCGQVKKHSARSDYRHFAMMCLSASTLVFAALFGEESEVCVHSSGCAWYGHLWRGRVRLIHAAVLRPCVGLATSYLLFACATGRAPRLEGFLAARIWTPLAALSYSMYLLFDWGFDLILVPTYEYIIQGKLAGFSLAGKVAVAYCMPILGMLGTLPLAFLSFLLIERSARMLSTRLLGLDSITPSTKDSEAAVQAALPDLLGTSVARTMSEPAEP
mmetsp:Transcript_83437/g.147429  ORF Transcript_83437/g.147429 Transcript_83437/m.147429 type:complete len:233 (-) Transcript_83437:263-961(-)